jgi:hypothetical protein
MGSDRQWPYEEDDDIPEEPENELPPRTHVSNP